MIRRRHVLLGMALTVGCLGAARCGGGGTVKPQPPAACADTVQVTVTMMDTVPVFSWSPDCTIGRMLVEQGIDEYWGTETPGLNVYRSPITYDVNPPDTATEEPARPLQRGLTYTVTLYAWITYTPVESMQVVGFKTFTP